MTARYQQGIMTLFMTSLLLSAALVITLGSYKALFYQIKRAQNEVKARQQFWIAEGGLECIFSLANTSHQLPVASSYPVCNQLGVISYRYQQPERTQLTVAATYGYSTVHKSMIYQIISNIAERAVDPLVYAELSPNPDSEQAGLLKETINKPDRLSTHSVNLVHEFKWQQGSWYAQ